jgi:hypothetical protein
LAYHFLPPAEAPTFVEKLFQFNRPEFQPSGISYPVEGGK